MTSKLGSAGKGAATGATMGAALGPYGALAGGVVGGVYGYLSGGPSDAEKAQAAAEAAKVEQQRQAAIALSNYRQTSRSQYHNLLTNETVPYQDYSNHLAGMTGGGGMSTKGLSAAENPVSLADTGVGAAQGSNFTGWDDKYDTGKGGYATHHTVHHTGIGEILNGTAQAQNLNPVNTYSADPTALNPDMKMRRSNTVVDVTGNQAQVDASRQGPTPQPTFAPRPQAAPTVTNLSFAPRRS